MTTWKFVTNHGAVLALIAQHGQITAREIAMELNITERSVHRIITDLEEAGYLGRFKEGRVNVYKIYEDVPLRRPEQRDTAVAGLLKVLLPNDSSDNKK